MEDRFFVKVAARPSWCIPTVLRRALNIPFIFKGKTFHDPLNPREEYEFYGHLRYFTHVSLIEFVTDHGFTAEAVYLGKPEVGTR